MFCFELNKMMKHKYKGCSVKFNETAINDTNYQTFFD